MARAPDIDWYLSEYATTLCFRDVPPAVVEHAKRLVLDAIACMVGAVQTTPAQLVIAAFGDRTGSVGARVAGTALQLGTADAAYVGSYLANALDYDDYYPRAQSHPGAVVIPAALAVAQSVEPDGKDLLEAILAGYEIGLRVGLAINPSPARYRLIAGFATWQIFGATVAACRLLRLSPSQTRHALGLAAASAPVPSVQLQRSPDGHVSWLKNNYGMSSWAAVTAAVLASRGFVGTTGFFEGTRGFWRIAGSDRFDPQPLLAGMDGFLIDDVVVKAHAACMDIHAAIDAVRELKLQSSFEAGQVRRIDVYVARDTARDLSGPYPSNLVEGQFHIPYQIALELLPSPDSARVSEGSWDAPLVMELTRRVSLHPDAAATRAVQQGTPLSPARVVVTLRSGKQMQNVVEWPRGLSDDSSVAKYRSLVEPRIGHSDASRISDSVSHLEELSRQELGQFWLAVAGSGADGPV